MNKLIAFVNVHYKNGEKQKLALVETETDFVIAPYFISVEKGWNGSGIYLNKRLGCSALDALAQFEERARNESFSVFVEKITF